MNFFSNYMDHIKAEPELKQKTEEYVRVALMSRQKQAEENGGNYVPQNQSAKRFRVAAVAVAAALVLTVGGYAFYSMPVRYLCLDINPSVELGVNAFGRVVSAEAYNEDGGQLLAGCHLTFQQVEDAVGTLVEQAAAQGYLAADGTTVIAVTAEANREQTALALQGAAESGVVQALGAAQADAIVYADCADLHLRTEARKAGLSPGKYKLIGLLQELDPSATLEQYQDAKVTQIIAVANQLMMQSPNGQQSGADAGALERLRVAAQQLQQAQEGAQQEQNRNEEQNQYQGAGSGFGQPEQNQEQQTNGETTAQQNQGSGSGLQQQNQQNQSDTSQGRQQAAGSDTTDTLSDQGQEVGSGNQAQTDGTEMSGNAGGQTGSGNGRGGN